MAGRGPAPKDPSKQMGHRTKAELARKTLPPVADEVVCPELPVGYSLEVAGESVDRVFVDLTRDWFEDWCHSPQVSQFTRNAWRRLLMLAPLVDEYHRNPTVALMAEVRQNEAKLGATPEDMQRLHWSVPTTEAEKAKGWSPAQRRQALKVV